MKRFYLLLLLILTSCQGGFDKKIDKSKTREFAKVIQPSETREFISSPSTDSHKKIGIILPSVNSFVEKYMMDAILLRLYDIADNTIDLRIFDIEEIKNDLQSFKQILTQENIKIIIGLIDSKESLNLASQLKEDKVEVISSSNNPSIYEANLHLIGITLQNQLHDIISYGLENDYANYFLLLPSNSKGRFYASYFKDSLMNSKAQINSIEYYADINSIEIGCKNILNKARSIPGKKMLFFSDNKKNLQILSQQLSNIKLDRQAGLQLISTGDIEELDNFSISKLYNVKFAGPKLEARNKFKIKFKKEFGYEPPIIASLAYDALSLAINVVNSRASKSFINKEGFEGISGFFRFEEKKSLAERNLAILEYQEGQLKEVESLGNNFCE